MVASTEAPRGRALLSTVRRQIQDVPDLVYVIDSQASGEDVRLRVAFDGSDESGGGGTYYRFVARLCVEYRITGGPDASVTVQDTRCPEDLLRPRTPTPAADGTVSLEG